MKNIEWTKLLFYIILCEAVGIFGSIFTLQAIPTWYATLNKPWFSPPNWIFGPVWTALYALMGTSLYLVWKRGVKKPESKLAVQVFILQLVINSIWSVIFFGLQNIAGALITIIILWLLIAETTTLFHKIDKKAAYLLLPYLGWVSFASVLNFYLWKLNT